MSPNDHTIVVLLSRQGDSFLVSRFLKEKGFQVFQELPKPGEQEVDAILLDVRLPKEKLKEALVFKRKALLFLPLIALVPERMSTKVFYKMGFDDCWHYPLYQEELFRRLRFFLNFREKMRQLKEKEENQRLEALGYLALGVAHDFNNLLSPILSYADLCLLKAREDEELASHLRYIKELALKSRGLIEQIFSFCNPARDTEDQIELIAEIRQLFPLLKAALPKDIRLDLELAEGPYWVKIHPSKLHRLLLNLITNAVKATGQSGQILLKVGREDGKVFIMVRDYGKGLDEEARQNLFKLFYSSRKTTGIGLNIVKDIVEEARGEISFESQEGVGTTFKILLPLAKKQTLTRAISSLTEKALKTHKTSAKILVVDDEITILELFKQFLEVLGFEVLTASSGQEALRLFAQHQEEVVLLVSDYFLTDTKGDELVRKIKEITPGLPVIFCTGAQQQIKLPGLSRLRTLRKPFSLADLQDLISELLAPEKKVSSMA